MRIAMLVIALVGISAVSVQAKSVGGYTNEQAARGATVYTQYCAVCHGANLQGEAGVAAYDAKNGQQRWRWMSTDAKTYAGNSWESGGGMVWTTPAIAPKLGLLIFSTGNPNPDLDGSIRQGDNLYTDSIVALDVHSGEFKWHYQEVKHDVWDYDAVSNVVLFDVHRNGEVIPAAAEAGKVGWVFILDRRTGELIRKSDPYVMMSKNMFTTPTAEGVDMLPGANGGAEWLPPAYSPQTHHLYIMAMDQLMHFTTKPAESAPGLIRLGSAFTNVAPGGIQDGPFVALDVETGKIAWQYKTPQPLIGGYWPRPGTSCSWAKVMAGSTPSTRSPATASGAITWVPA